MNDLALSFRAVSFMGFSGSYFCYSCQQKSKLFHLDRESRFILVYCCRYNILMLNSLTTIRQTTNFSSANFQKMLNPSFIILRIQKLEGKQCKSRSWATSSRSTLFANSAVGGRVVRWSWVSFQCRGVLQIWMIVGQGPIALAVGACGGCLDIFTLLYLFTSFSPSLWETTRYRLKYCLKGPLNPKKKKKKKKSAIFVSGA